MLLLRLMASRTELGMTVGCAAAALDRERRALHERDREIARLRRALQRIIPTLRGSRAASSRESRARQVIRRMMEQIQREFASPLTLSRLAAEFGMNASYLSSTFAREAGIPFKSYLTTLRIQRARELLSDPRHRISDVATLVGYSGAGRFRAAFRSWIGMAPSRWRESLHAD